jgi:hypothetical protein
MSPGYYETNHALTSLFAHLGRDPGLSANSPSIASSKDILSKLSAICLVIVVTKAEGGY